jgi:hypothetical protein
MTLWGFDISDYQGDFDMDAAKRAGFSFVIIKVTEGSAWKSKYFKANYQRARDTGLLTCGYHYQRSNASPHAQADNFASMAGTDVGFIPDVEANGGGVDLTRAILAELRTEGYSSPLSYIPKWYWQQIGSPNLSGLAQLWQSHYPDNKGGSVADIYKRVPSSWWTGFGGQPIKILQFTSLATVAGRTPIDGDAFEGSIQDLTALLGGKLPTPAPSQNGGGAAPSGLIPTRTQMEENSMDPVIHKPTPVVTDEATGKKTQVELGQQVVPGCAGVLQVTPLDDQMCFFGNPDPEPPIYCYGPGGGMGGGHSVLPRDKWQDGTEKRATRNNCQSYEVPKGTTRVAYALSSNGRTAVQFVPNYLLG